MVSVRIHPIVSNSDSILYGQYTNQFIEPTMTTFKDQIAAFLCKRQDQSMETVMNIANTKGKIPNAGLRVIVNALVHDAHCIGFENGVEAFKELSMRVQKKQPLEDQP